MMDVRLGSDPRLHTLTHTLTGMFKDKQIGRENGEARVQNVITCAVLAD